MVRGEELSKHFASADNTKPPGFPSTCMTDTKPKQTLLHPQLGLLPARRVLDCVFALPPDGPMLHRHMTDVTINPQAAGIQYILRDQPPSAEHARCRIIPPRVREF